MEVTIPAPDGDITGYLAVPSGPGPFPAVVIIHDALGLSADARRITDRFADSGYVALSPDLHSRGGFFRCVRQVFKDMFARRGRAFDDIETARAFLAARDDCTGKIGVAGYCLGGGFALVAASRSFDASAPYYGQLPRDLSVLDDACPIVASFGRRDPSLRGAATKLDAALTERNIPHDVKEYPHAGHSFANKIAPAPVNTLLRVLGVSYHEDSDLDAWQRVMSFFGEHLS
ncbi:dienelactone hydrolase family protein [Amycolatopsis sp. FDAARGOS 1241]|uniref:dienelactone hydrolase family protein n=1 Tax=Amycolatopsis sp. FDAARGOS 1241 TaxID=2778070 RepID=UPI0019529F58|nr:dienelactone hydrolase family protein [Amycolatopsis sp. FDAARGOS 1241]QRP46226.1 dienelactone hydrolase family protein [Amycolatopsis sp. FDAARGOS 1241]